MPEWTLSVRSRVPGHPGRQREAGDVPAVLYGRDLPSQPLAVDRHDLLGLLSRGGAHRVIQLDLEGEARPAVMKELQWHPVDGSLVHVDFHAVALDEVMHAEVPVRLVGEGEVQRRGGLVEQERHALHVACLPGDLPEFIPVEVGELSVGTVVTAADVALPSGVRLLDSPEDLILSVSAPRVAAATTTAEPEAEAAVAAAAGEPEVVGRRVRPEGEREG